MVLVIGKNILHLYMYSSHNLYFTVIAIHLCNCMDCITLIMTTTVYALEKTCWAFVVVSNGRGWVSGSDIKV